MRLISVTIIVFCLALPGAATAYGQQVGADLTRGQALVTKQCASCHAVGRTGASRHETAPAFRTLSQRYKIEALEEALAEGLSSGHPDMPEFVFEADDVGAIIAYLNSIQDR